MHDKMIPTSIEAALDRVLAGLEAELAAATDEEIVQAGLDLGMNVKMKGTAAFLGVLGPMPKRLSDIFDLADLARMRSADQGLIDKRRSSLPSVEEDRSDDDDGE